MPLEAVRLAGKALPDRPLAELSVLEGSTALQLGSDLGGFTQRSQYPLFKEYTLNHNIKAPIIKVYSLVK